jgi:hypothetical protein
MPHTTASALQEEDSKAKKGAMLVPGLTDTQDYLLVCGTIHLSTVTRGHFDLYRRLSKPHDGLYRVEVELNSYMLCTTRTCATM